MGHVDHGKTTLLDSLRKSRVAAGEAGGITQHIGAFSVTVNGELITFLDTPGHAAFSAIRSRGAKVTDLIVLVVAAGDGVMAQTREAIELAQTHQVPMVVAVNKCDAFGPDAIQKAKDSLLREQVLLEEVGGDTQTVCVSALTGQGIPDLLQAINAQAELMELQADPEASVRATVIEARQLKGQGEAATVVVAEGTLRPGNVLVGEESYCRVRSMCDHNGRPVEGAGPAVPVEITGWRGRPEPGSSLHQVATEQEAHSLVQERQKMRAEIEALDAVKVARDRERLDDRLWEIIKNENADPAAAPRTVRAYDEVSQAQSTPCLQLFIKTDAVGSLEAVEKVISEIPQRKCRLSVVHASVGPVTVSDAEHCKATGSLLVAFNQSVDKAALRQMKSIALLTHKVIYHLVDEIKDRMVKSIPPVWKETILGQARILQIFQHGDHKGDLIAGCTVTDGVISRTPVLSQPQPGLPPMETVVRLMRNQECIRDRIHLRSMRHFKKEIATAGKGLECGILFEDQDIFDIAPDDVLIQVQRTPSFDKLE
jgi:translation initiation factor IF-2